MQDLTQSQPTILPLAEVHPLPSATAGPPIPKGIARLAASAPRAGAKKSVEYFELTTRSILNRCTSERVPFTWTINPYRGCEFGCKYCYARYTHEYLELDGADFERKIYAKQHARVLLARELEREKICGEHIAIGTATDPYQPAEREFGVTRAILETLAEKRGLSLSLTTKSNHVVRDLDLLRRLHERSRLHINLTVTTLNARLARALEPRAPTPALRLEAVRTLRAAGLTVGVFVMPILPGITDRVEDLEMLVRTAALHDAEYIAAGVLFLMPSAQKQFFPFLEQRFPRLVRQYRKLYARSAYAPNEYKRHISQLMASLRTKHGLAASPKEYLAETLAAQSPQLNLFAVTTNSEQDLPQRAQRTQREESPPLTASVNHPPCSCRL